MCCSLWTAVGSPSAAHRAAPMSALTHISMQEQYAFLYEVLLEGLLCGCTGVPVERVASHISCLQGAETQSQNSVLEKEFKVPPGPGAAGLLPPATTLTQPWVRGGGSVSLCFTWRLKGSQQEGLAQVDHLLQAVQKFSELFQLLPCREAEKPSNQPKNRKPGILPGTAGLEAPCSMTQLLRAARGRMLSPALLLPSPAP